MIVVGAALVIGVGVIGLAWTLRDDEPGQVTTEDVGAPTAPGATATSTAPPGGSPGSSPSALDGPVLDVSSLAVAPGDTITVAGSGCGVGRPPTVGAWEARVWLAPAPGTVPWDPAFGDPIRRVAPDADGHWEVTVTVPQWSTDYRLEAACFDQATPPAGFLYRHERVVASEAGGG
jgi:hypothetical protein